MRLIIHVPKTAGTSLRVAMQKKYGEPRIAYDYHKQSAVTSDIVRRSLYDGESQTDVSGLIAELRSRDCTALIGHFPFSKYGPHFTPSEVITFVREPWVRACSEYLHRVVDGTFAGSIEEFIEMPAYRNLQAWTLEGIHEESFIGITEKYKDSLAILARRYGLRLRHRRDNPGPEGGGNRLADQLGSSLKQRFIDLNELDVKLYQDTLARFERDRATKPSRFFKLS